MIVFFVKNDVLEIFVIGLNHQCYFLGHIYNICTISWLYLCFLFIAGCLLHNILMYLASSMQ